MTRSVVVALVLVCSSACGAGSSGEAEEAKQAKAVAAKRAAPADREAAKVDRGELLNALNVSKTETKEILQAYADGALGERLSAGEMVIVDAKAPKGTDQAQYYLLPATFAGPTSTGADLLAAIKTRKDGGQRALSGGEDGDRPGLFRKVVPGQYLACAAVGPQTSPDKQAYLDAAKAALGGSDESKTDVTKLAAAAKAAQEKTGYKPTRLAWETVPARCKQVEVTGDASSRVIVLEPAAATPTAPGSAAATPTKSSSAAATPTKSSSESAATAPTKSSSGSEKAPAPAR